MDSKISNVYYHLNKSHLSSSSLKLLLKSAEKFNEHWNLGIKSEDDDKVAFQDGSLIHSLVLEPHLVKAEYAFFQGLRRTGKLFEHFKSENPGKRILTEAQHLRAIDYLKAYNARSEATALIQGGEAEFTIEGEILDVPCKARFDYINVEKGYLIDLKSTAMPSGADIFKDAINMYRYDLSAALYLMLAEKRYGITFDWYFVVISKCDKICDVYKLSQETRRAGVAFVYQALLKYKKCKASNLWVDSPPDLCNNQDYLVEEV